MKGGTQGFPRHEVSDKQEVLFVMLSSSFLLLVLGSTVRKKISGRLSRDCLVKNQAVLVIN